MGLGKSLRHAWNAFTNEDENRARNAQPFYGQSYGSRPDRTRFNISNERSILSSIYTRLSIDVSDIDIRHVRLDDQKRYKEDMNTGLNSCLTLEANMDQAGRAFLQDIVMTMFDKGTAAIVPIDTTLSPEQTAGYDILNMRVGEIVEWMPDKVRVSVYNEKIGRRQEVTLPKSLVAIADNPLYSVMNEPNSTLKRLNRKMNLLDSVDEASSSGKLDIIVQLPYAIKSETKRQQAQQRRDDLEAQLKGSTYGIGYVDGTEKITQLNRPAENNLLAQVQYLTETLYAELGLTPEVMNGTADEAAMLNYHKRTIIPLIDAIVEAMRRTFLTKTARTQRQDIRYFNDPFALVPVSQLAEIADKFTRNKIATANEMRGVVGWAPSSDPEADKLVNSNMPEPTPQTAPVVSDKIPPTAPAAGDEKTPPTAA